MEVTISVIIPVYNSELFLDRCLSSVLSQTFVDFEVLLINDGSTDSSVTICERYEKEDSRIRFFNRSNHGVSATRQFGIDHCRGKYCIQIDSDDWIDKDCFEKLISKAKSTQADIVYMGLVKEFEDRSEPVRMYRANDIEDYLSAVMCGKCWGAIVNKLVLTDLFRINEIVFPENVCMWEDSIFLIKCLMCAKSIMFCEGIYYHYTQYNSKSLCSTIFSYDVPAHMIAAVSDLDRFVESIGKSNKYRNKLAVLKQFAKQKLLLDPHFRNISEWFLIFPESNKYFVPFVFCALQRKIFSYY
ncbi:glycosyltransferase family 2 protein [Parabacteroides distasonis]|jgi:glycosyltransferase involved in cell wall biosynthesis|nr:MULTISPECIES: glycosyltransferase family 2 protein [Parabacteroides]EEY84484.1 glycosyltransferase, group 2 family protein [Bacteroides sp. 2_1_33B]MDB9026973.1 glycosyltransferase family 2 protein [Parabacteroides distasonis]MDB9043716.1 glycosyltransferase family 2 protein [Parabacteroides distasonis]MDB9161801.1 glycosyltransferase family 2 protein [Parabacteroides distasonis]MDO5430707.1 glycosyltransferase family 2 protein [Parabacteroides sp.]